MANYNGDKDTHYIARQCAHREDVQPYAKIVGQWVWCEFPTEPSKETKHFLTELGFRFNKTRNAWQHPCGVYRKFTRKRTAALKNYYGVKAVEEFQ